MKNYHACFLFLILVFFSSCEEKIFEKDSNIEKETNSIIGISNIDGILHFESEQDFLNLMDLQSKQIQEKNEEFEKSFNFISCRMIADEAFDCMGNVKTEDDFYEIMDEYSDVIYLDGEIVRRVVDDLFYSRICNRDGIFFIGDKALKVTKEGYYSSEKGNIQDLILAAKEENSGIDGVTFTGKHEPMDLKSVQICGMPEIIDSKISDSGRRMIEYEVSTSFFYEPAVYYNPCYKGHYRITCKTRTYWKVLWWFAEYNNPHYISGFKVGVETPPYNNCFFREQPEYPYYTPVFTMNYLTLGYASTYPSEYTTKTWKENERIGYDVYFDDPGFSPTSKHPALIKYLDINVWSRGVPEDQKLIGDYNCP
ncbi:MAG: hypothetical protein JW798_12790 [Prolixibacteraceae bacterium]|nr:hypothetical protein [Prolixibacteraceae bacterium]